MPGHKLPTATPNRFKEYHEYLKNHNALEFQSTVHTICEVLGISVTSYYRIIKKPQALSIAEKRAIASVYQLPEHFIFPELENAA